jgi:methionyl-tRNA synthetase
LLTWSPAARRLFAPTEEDAQKRLRLTLPADLWRWWLVANAPETSDTDFTFDRFVADVNKDLADVFGNTFLQHAAPWSAGADRAAVITRVTLNLVRLCAIAAHSIVPSLSGIVLSAFDDDAVVPRWPAESLAKILDGNAGRPVRPIGRLVEKLSDTDALRLKRRFGDSDKRAAFERG